jgi:hypothetical protein
VAGDMMKLMDATAQANTGTSSQLLGRLRSSFAVQNQVKVNDASLTAAVSPKPASTQNQLTAKPTTTSKVSDQLQVLDQVLTEVEQQRQVVADPAPAQPAPAQLPAAPNLAADHRQQVGMVVQAAPAAVNQTMTAIQTAQAAAQGASAKEVAPVNQNVAVETGAGVQYVEVEPTPEISPELSEYMQHVENHANQEAQEIVVAEDQQQVPLASHYPKQSVVVLPVSVDQDKQGGKKSPKHSFRWLVEWSRKLMKIFSGKIIYREVEG